MDLQKIIASTLSILTTIPIYFLCKKFTSKYFAVFGSTIFAYDPRLIQDSLAGLNNSLYILLVTISLLLFLNSDKRLKYISFGLVGFSSIVRSEGLFLFFALSIAYFIHYRKNRNALLRYGILLTVFIITVLPIAVLRMETTGNDALAGRIISEATHTSTALSSTNDGIFNYIADTLKIFFRFLGIDLLPNFIFFVPIGIFLIFRKRNNEKITLIVTLIVTVIPVLYAYSFPALDTKYFYPLYPIFCVLSSLAIQKYCEIIPKPKFLLVIATISIIVLSFIFLLMVSEFRLIGSRPSRSSMFMPFIWR